MKRIVIAFLLNAFVLPGVGQIYLGRKVKGVVLVMAVNLLLLAALFFMMKISSPVIAAHLSGTPITPQQVLEAIQPYSLWAKLLLSALLGVWGFGLVDLISVLRSPPHE
jgi:TM2 domain-containing membrane protein YozV